ncbi:universal stress protein [Streptomyces sp. NBRC 110611]|uniref:universal stress protein n=1 Tax=Streptomyces sp. NBRC 110611 TaxID=1621259 RepID=UPI00082DB449|nr:universal stress protein [Streptomyces sp. NBRC 110611]
MSCVTAGLNGSPESVAAAEWAAREALLRAVPLRLVHADEWPAWATIPAASAQVRDGWAHGLLAEVAAELQQEHPALEISTRLLWGPPATALSIEAADADLLVLGSRGLSGVKGFLIGSVGMATITSTEQPVVLVRAPKQPGEQPPSAPPKPSRDVVVGVDIQHPCDALLAFAFDEAARRDRPLRAVYGWSLPPLARSAPALEEAEREMAPDIARRLSEVLLPWRRRFPSVDVEERSPIGGPAPQLLHAAADAELVVIGRRVRRSPLGTHIGSVAHAVLHHCPAPVAVIAHG